jgi:hypothetical protein
MKKEEIATALIFFIFLMPNNLLGQQRETSRSTTV